MEQGSKWSLGAERFGSKRSQGWFVHNFHNIYSYITISFNPFHSSMRFLRKLILPYSVG